MKGAFYSAVLSVALLSAGCATSAKTTALRSNTPLFRHPHDYVRIARVHAAKTFTDYSRAKFPYDQEPTVLARKLGPDITDYRVTVVFSTPFHIGHYSSKEYRRKSIETVITSAGRIVSATLRDDGGELEDLFTLFQRPDTERPKQ